MSAVKNFVKFKWNKFKDNGSQVNVEGSTSIFIHLSVSTNVKVPETKGIMSLEAIFVLRFYIKYRLFSSTNKI